MPSGISLTGCVNFSEPLQWKCVAQPWERHESSPNKSRTWAFAQPSTMHQPQMHWSCRNKGIWLRTRAAWGHGTPLGAPLGARCNPVLPKKTFSGIWLGCYPWLLSSGNDLSSSAPHHQVWKAVLPRSTHREPQWGASTLLPTCWDEVIYLHCCLAFFTFSKNRWGGSSHRRT